MRRALAVGLATGTFLVMGATGAVAGADPSIYHTIKSAHGYAAASQLDGCELTEVFVSSSTAMYAGQPGPVNKQGLTGVFVRVTDACTAPAGEASVGAVAPAAAGGGEVLFEAEGQNDAALQVDARLNAAYVDTTLSGTDAEGNPVTIVLSASWTATGPLEHSTGHTHVLFPGEGVVNSTGNNLMRPATAEVAVSVDGRSVTAVAPDAVLELTRSICVEVPRPGVEEFYPCFGFPG